MSESEPASDNKNEEEKESQSSGGETSESGGGEKSAAGSGEPEDDKSRDENKPGKQQPRRPPLYKKPAFIISVSIASAILVAGGICVWLVVRQYVSTDDAYIDGHVVQLSPQIGARVLQLDFVDNQLVHKNDLLIQLDPIDYEVALQQARAQVSTAAGRLEQSRAQIGSARAAVTRALAEEHAAQASLDNASKDLERFQQVDERARSKQQLDNAIDAHSNATAQLEQARAQMASAHAGVTTAEAAVKAAQGELNTAEAYQKRAEVNLSYCRIVAPANGRITQRTVETGDYVTTGQALCLIVDPDVWVTANFKETQLNHLRPGQPATIKVDAFPGLEFRGHVDSIQAGSGSRFSVLPAENATGNYVKVVQRVPVKIVFEHGSNTSDAPMLSPGLSVIPRVKIR